MDLPPLRAESVLMLLLRGANSVDGGVIVTIAVCYVSPEGIVLGADSTTSVMMSGGGFQFLNHNQKIFEVGTRSTYGILTWGLASLDKLSHRTQIALLADGLAANPPGDLGGVCERWIDLFWKNYQGVLDTTIEELQRLRDKSAFDPTNPGAVNARSLDEEQNYQQMKLGLVVGFCIGGYHPANREPSAYEIIFDPLAGKPLAKRIDIGDTRCWGAPKVFNRIVRGVDPEIRNAVLTSGKWMGNEADLDAILINHELYMPSLPVRDAVDFVHSCISSTIKTLKFSHLSPTCGGPIELAVITSDREFRWVRHKEWDVALREGAVLWKI